MATRDVWFRVAVRVEVGADDVAFRLKSLSKVPEALLNVGSAPQRNGVDIDAECAGAIGERDAALLDAVAMLEKKVGKILCSVCCWDVDFGEIVTSSMHRVMGQSHVEVGGRGGTS